MKTIDEIKDEVAKEKGYKNFDECYYTYDMLSEDEINEVIIRYATEAIKEAAQLCDDIEDDRYEHKNHILSLINELK